ncbi:MAG: hypothetical protein AAGC64_06615 [Bacteroidota bacterium]
MNLITSSVKNENVQQQEAEIIAGFMLYHLKITMEKIPYRIGIKIKISESTDKPRPMPEFVTP